MSDVWYSEQIARMEITPKRSAETIRKHMKRQKSWAESFRPGCCPESPRIWRRSAEATLDCRRYSASCSDPENQKSAENEELCEVHSGLSSPNAPS